MNLVVLDALPPHSTVRQKPSFYFLTAYVHGKNSDIISESKNSYVYFQRCTKLRKSYINCFAVGLA